MNLIRLNLPLFYLVSRLYNDVESRTTRIKNNLIIMLAMLNKKSMHIMLADDDSEDREIFLSAVEEVAPDVRVSEATNGQELMKILFGMNTLPDILFLDLNMPLKNGQECLREIRSNDKLKNLPVVIYSTSASREYIDQTFMGGANYYLPKPDSFRDLKLITQKLFSMDWDNLDSPKMEKFVLNNSVSKRL